MSTGAGMPPSAVLGLTAAVLAAHVWLLHRGPPRIQPPPAVRPVAFITRGIVAMPPPAVAAPAMSPASPRSLSPAPARPVARSPAAAPARAEPGAVPSAVPNEAAASPPAAAAMSIRIPASVQLRYQVAMQARQQASVGTSELTWRHEGTSYEARFEISAPPSRPRVQHSAGSIGSLGLEPARFGDRGRGEQAAHFDREGQRVVFSNNRPAAPLAPGAQDRLSVLLQLAALVAGSPDKFPAGAIVVVQTATTREADRWIFTVDGEEELQLPGGDLRAVKLSRPPRGEFDPRLEVWLAPGQAYVPVRLRLTQPNGDWADHQWLATDRR
ncbi:MAG TPA: DUF3108 domain-containing protein [Ramlibacter sp.]